MKKLIAVLTLLPCSYVYAQEVRANITGIVRDQSGGPVAMAVVIATNVAQNASTQTVSSETGNFVTPFLAPGTYRLTVERPGFKKFIREDIVLQAQDRARLDVQLEVGELSQSVTVSADISLLQTETASRGQIIANQLIESVPTQGRNPFQLAWSAPGVIKTGDWRYLRPFDIGGTTGFSINGGLRGQNEVLLDGISNVRGSGTVVHVPTMESVQEFKVLSNTYDSQYGRTGGGIVTIVTKSGGNQFHGNLFEYFQAEELNANQSELNRTGTKKPPMNINTFGFQASGPVLIPRVFNGKNRLFWLVSYEGMRQRSADPGAVNFPLDEWRQGDFSNLLNAQGSQVLIYDPLTTTSAGTRQPFAGNRIPAGRIHPIAREVLKFYPSPNSPGDGPARVNNYIFPSRWVADMDEWIGRADYIVNSRNTVYFRYGQNPFSEFRGLVWNGSNPAEPSGNAPLLRNGRNWTMDWTSTLSPRMTFNLRAGLSRWEEQTGNSFGADFNPAQLGFDQALVSQYTKLQFPLFDIGTYQNIGSNRLLALSPNDSYTIQPNMSLMVGSHFLKFGGEGRRYNDNTNNPGVASGSFQFGKNWTQQRALQADAVSGNELATMLLGYPTTAFVDRNIDPAFRNQYFALFIQDDWKLTSRLTLNFGLRWDYEAPMTERYDRMLRGLDFDAASPIQPQVAGLQLKGAVQFAGLDGQPRGAFERDRNNFQPRIGAAYRFGDSWVIRGGYGLYYLGQNQKGSQLGFSQRTNAIVSTDGNLTPAVSLANPFANLPGGRLLSPVGSSEGAASFLGQTLDVNYLNRPLAYSHQYSIDIQRELPGRVLAEVAFVGNLTRNMAVNGIALNSIFANELGRRTPAGAIDTAYYTAQVPNPMRGLIPNNATLNGANIPRQRLLVPFPQYNAVNLNNVPIGSQRYDGMQARISKRFSEGLTLHASYSIGKTLEKLTMLNPQDFVLNDPSESQLEKRSATETDVPQKFVVVGVYELPFGRGQRYGADMPSALNMLLGGWQMNWDITYQSGWAVDYPNAPQVKPGSANFSGRSTDRWFDTSLWTDPTTGRLVQRQEQFTLRNFPSRFSDVRVPGYRNWDASVSKHFPIAENVRLQFRFEMINAFNTPWFSRLASGGNDVTNANFGRLDVVQRNLPRFIKLGLNLKW